MNRRPNRQAIMASVLTADFAALGDQCRRLEMAGVDGIHWDVMDGLAVPSLSFGPDVIAACRRHTAIPFEAHLMTNQPDRLVDQMAQAGCQTVIVHPDWLQNPRRTLQGIQERGLSAGVALSPGSPVDLARWHLDIVDLVLVMTVEPGYGGQQRIALMTDKVREVSLLVERQDRRIEIEVDGGVRPDNIAEVFGAGAGRFVIGSALWEDATFEAAVTSLREAAASP